MKPLLTTLILSFFILPLITFAQYTPPIADGVITGEKNGLVPCEGSFCGTCDVIVLANTGIKWLLTLTFLFFAVLAVRAGVKLITSQGNSGALSEAKQSFTNAFIGLIIMLVAWLIVDTMLRQLLAGGTGDVNGYGPWSKVQCTSQVIPGEAVAGYFKGDLPYVPGQPMSSYSGPGYTGGPLPLCTNSYCSVTVLQSAGFTASQARVMSCIALTESSGVPSTPPFNIANPNHKPLSTACGLFQITGTTWRATATGACSSFSNCTNAACNTQTAVKLVRQSGYTPWTCKNCNSKAQACITQYGGG